MKLIAHAFAVKPLEVELVLVILLGGMMAAVIVLGLALGYRSAAKKHDRGDMW